MDAFLQALRSDSRDSIAAFFPRRGDWSWVRTVREPNGPAVVVVGVRRFSGAETVRVIGRGGPACGSVDQGNGHSGPFEEHLGMQARMHRGSWPRVDATRFVPPGGTARSPIFVEWKKEDGEWVVLAIGDQSVGFPHPPLTRSDVQRGTPVDSAETDATRAAWFRENAVIHFNGLRYVKYGYPRSAERSRLSRFGHRDGVPLFVESGTNEAPDVFYVPVGPSLFQLYETHGPAPCQ